MNCYQCLSCKNTYRKPMETAVISNLHHKRHHGDRARDISILSSTPLSIWLPYCFKGSSEDAFSNAWYLKHISRDFNVCTNTYIMFNINLKKIYYQFQNSSFIFLIQTSCCWDGSKRCQNSEFTTEVCGS